MYRATYATEAEIPERVRPYYDEQPDGSWRFAMDVPGEDVPEELVGRIERRAEARVAAAEAKLQGLTGELETIRAETETLRTDVRSGKVADAVREAARAEGVLASAFPDVEAAALADGLSLEGDRVVTRDGRSAREWLIDKRQDRRHWFRPPSAPRPRLFS